MKDKGYSNQTKNSPAIGPGVMGQAGTVKHIQPCVFPDQKKVDVMPTTNRGYDSEAWNYKY